MKRVVFAVTQMACGEDREENLRRAGDLIRRAAGMGAQVVLLQELFAGPYFCKDQKLEDFSRAETLAESVVVRQCSSLAAELGVVLPVSFFERAGQAYFNSLAMVDADGAVLGVYRKSHIPQGPGYEEKFFFSPGDTGFRVWKTRYGTLGVGICWDQWFPEAARAMALMGAEALLYPTAIGSEPGAPEYDSSGHWQRTMQGHAAANCLPVMASNRIGLEVGESCELRFYGTSFIADQTGALLAQASRDEEELLTAEFDLDALRRFRAGWGLFRDRRPDLYGPLLTLDGERAS